MNRQEKQQELGISGEEECWILSSRTRLRDPKCHPACQEDFGFCSTIFFGPHLSVPTTGTKGCCGLIFSAASISCSLGTPEKGHINARRSWWRPRAEWRHLLCLNKPALGAGGVNMAGPPSLRCLPGNGLARAGPGRDVSSLWHHWRSWSLSLSLWNPLDEKATSESSKLGSWYLLWRDEPWSWIRARTESASIRIMNTSLWNYLQIFSAHLGSKFKRPWKFEAENPCLVRFNRTPARLTRK